MKEGQLTIAGQVDVEIGQTKFALVFERRSSVVDFLPTTMAMSGPIGILFHFALAGNAQSGVGQGVEPRLGDLAPAELATTVKAVDDPLQGVLDLAELSTFNLDDLRADLIVRGINSGVDAVANDVEGGEFAIGVEVASQCLTKGIAAGDQPRVESKQRVFAGQLTPPGVLRGGSTVAGR